jgi:hypothetical protein
LQLAYSIPPLYQYICDAVTEHSNIASQSLCDQWQQLILYPLSSLGESSCQSSYVLVIDALDECENDNIRILIHLLAEARSLVTFRLRIFLTSRPEVPIRYKFCQIPDAEHQDFVLHNISPPVVDHDIHIFLEYNLRFITQEFLLDPAWPKEADVKPMVQIGCKSGRVLFLQFQSDIKKKMGKKKFILLHFFSPFLFLLVSLIQSVMEGAYIYA